MATSSNRLITAILARLQAQLPDLAAAEELPAVVEYLPYALTFPDLSKAPQVWVEMRREDRSNLGAFGGANAKQARNRALIVGVTAAGADPESASTALLGYADLILQVMESDQTAGGEGFRVQWLDTRFTPNLADAPGNLFQAALLSFSILRWAPIGQD